MLKEPSVTIFMGSRYVGLLNLLNTIDYSSLTNTFLFIFAAVFNSIKAVETRQCLFILNDLR